MLRRIELARAAFAARIADITYIFEQVVSSPYFFIFGIVASVGWILIESFARNPFDPPHDFFPFLVLVITIIGYWIESAMKVQQARQVAQAQEQMDRLEAMARESNRRDLIIQNVVLALEEAVDTLTRHLDTGEEGYPNESSDLRGDHGTHSNDPATPGRIE